MQRAAVNQQLRCDAASCSVWRQISWSFLLKVMVKSIACFSYLLSEYCTLAKKSDVFCGTGHRVLTWRCIENVLEISCLPFCLIMKGTTLTLIKLIYPEWEREVFFLKRHFLKRFISRSITGKWLLFGLENIIFGVCRLMSPRREPSIHTGLCNGKRICLEQPALWLTGDILLKKIWAKITFSKEKYCWHLTTCSVQHLFALVN